MNKYRIVVVGGRKKAEFLAEALTKKKMDLVIVNDTARFCSDISHKYPNALIACGDGTKPYLYEDLNIDSNDIMISMMPSDADNLIACQIAKSQFHVKKVYCTVSNPKNVEVFKKLGINNVISSTYIVSKMIEQMVTLIGIENYIPIEQGAVALLELIIEQDFKVAQMLVSELDIPKESIIACIIRNGNSLIPRGDTQILINDKLILLSKDNEKENLLEVLTQRN